LLKTAEGSNAREYQDMLKATRLEFCMRNTNAVFCQKEDGFIRSKIFYETENRKDYEKNTENS
jgi:hypothetical protein